MMLKNKVLRYFWTVKTVFVKGSIHFAFKGDIIEIFYYPDKEGSFVSQRLSTRAKEYIVFRRIQDFCLDCYFEFEWDGAETEYSTLSKILGISNEQARSMISVIYSKIKRYGKHQFL